MKLVFTGGGTGGHIYPALALAESFRKKGDEILYIGSNDGLERRIVPEEGFDFQGIEVAPFPRNLSVHLFSSLLKTGRGFLFRPENY